MRVVVPFGATEPKTRLAPVLDADERREFAGVLLRDVLDALTEYGVEPTILADEPLECDAAVVVDDRPLTDAVNARLPGGADGGDEIGEGDDTGDGDGEAVAVVMADLPLATPAALDRLLGADGDVVLAPGRAGGTNALVARDPAFHVDYHGASIRDHRAIARAAGLDPVTVDSFRLATDVDEPADLVEVLLHAGGESADWLREAGFELTTDDGRVGLRRA